MFQKTKINRIYEDLVEQIEKAILDGRLKAGDRLPSQRDLQEMFQTSRGTLREALRVLEQKGLIDIKLGVSGGAIVKDMSTKPVSEGLELLIRHQKVSIEELGEFREGVEGNVAALAAVRAKKKDIKRLKALLDQTRENQFGDSEKHWEQSEQLDKELHVAIGEIAGNTVYNLVLRTVHYNIHQYYEQLLIRDTKIQKQNYIDFCEIVDAIEKKDPEKARSLVQNHVRRFNKYMIKEQKKYNRRKKNGE